MFCLNEDEKDFIWDALAIAEDYYDKEKREMAGILLKILAMVENVYFEFYKDGITEEGQKIIQEFLKNREKEKGNVIQFPLDL